MPATLSFRPLAPADPAMHTAIAGLWTHACGDDLAVSPRTVAYNVTAPTGGLCAGVIAYQGETPVGFVTVSQLSADPSVQSPATGWIDAIAVHPDHQRQGVGSALLAWAEGFLLGQGCRRILLGSSLRPFLPGVPVELETAGFFVHQGYGGDDVDRPTHESTWDVAADLSAYTPPPSLREVDAQIRPARPGDAEAVLTFLRREFPGRWRYEFEEFLRNGGRASDYMVLWTARGVDGCCTLTFEDSLRPIERFFPYRLPRPWGQLGSIGISEDRRGLGFGAALLDAGLRRLHDNGVNGCVIDWTNLVEFYGKFGFTPYRRYLRLHKQV